MAKVKLGRQTILYPLPALLVGTSDLMRITFKKKIGE